MVQPTSFGFDDQTARTNAFQRHPAGDKRTVTAQAQAEFASFVVVLRARHIDVTVFKDPDAAPKPNAVFPNNWLSTWPDGRVFLYPMATESRRPERSQAALGQITAAFRVTDTIDISASETAGRYLEGTGVLVFDHANKLAYASVSPRCDEQLAINHIKTLGYEPVIFHTADQDGVSIYHTNVMMGVQSTTAVICAEAITNEHERRQVLERLERTGHQVVTISLSQMTQFCGNVLELANPAGQKFLILSQAAYDTFTPQQRKALARDKELVPVAIPTVEAVGGGSARCMIAELFLEPQPSLASVAYS
jgi:hypothetical protein